MKPNPTKPEGLNTGLSVLNHESKPMKRVRKLGVCKEFQTFSTQPRVETDETWIRDGDTLPREQLSVLNHESKPMKLKSVVSPIHSWRLSVLNHESKPMKLAVNH